MNAANHMQQQALQLMRHITLVMVGQQDVFPTAGFHPVSAKCTLSMLRVHLKFGG